MSRERRELQGKSNLPPPLLELFKRNSSVAQSLYRAENGLGRNAFYSVHDFAVVVIDPEHSRFGQIGQLVNDWREFGKIDSIKEVQFLDGQKADFEHLPSQEKPAWDQIEYLNKRLLTEDDKKLIVAIVSGEDPAKAGEQIILPCEVVADGLRLYLSAKYVAGNPIETPTLPVLAHQFYCPEESCARWFKSLSDDWVLESGSCSEALRPWALHAIQSQLVAGDRERTEPNIVPRQPILSGFAAALGFPSSVESIPPTSLIELVNKIGRQINVSKPLLLATLQELGIDYTFIRIIIDNDTTFDGFVCPIEINRKTIGYEVTLSFRDSDGDGSKELNITFYHELYHVAGFENCLPARLRNGEGDEDDRADKYAQEAISRRGMILTSSI